MPAHSHHHIITFILGFLCTTNMTHEHESCDEETRFIVLRKHHNARVSSLWMCTV